jgi:putative hydrolase of the HAD superfamily
VLATLGLLRRFDGVIAIEDMAMFGELRPKPDARMLRRVAARLRVRPARCALVEDTLDHQKAARGIGMTTVWMSAISAGAGAAARRACRRPTVRRMPRRQARSVRKLALAPVRNRHTCVPESSRCKNCRAFVFDEPERSGCKRSRPRCVGRD